MSIEVKHQNLNRIVSWIHNCDTKSSFILTLQGLVLSLIFTSNFSSYFTETFQRNFTTELNLETILFFIEGVVLSLFLFTSLMQLVHILLALVARLNPKIYKEKGLVLDSIFFFGSIASMDYEKFKNTLKDSDEAKIENDLDSQIFINSKICNLKFKYYNKAIMYLFFSLILVIIYVILTNGKLIL